LLQQKKCLILPVGDRFKTLEIMNLENLGLVELNAQEVQEVEGGGLLLFPITGFVLGYLYEKYIA